MATKYNSKSRTYLRTTYTDEAQALEIQLFIRRDGERHQATPDHQKSIYFRYRYTGQEPDGSTRRSWSGIKSSGTTNEAMAFEKAKTAQKQHVLRVSSGRHTKDVTIDALFSLFMGSSVAAELAPASLREFGRIQKTYRRAGSAVFRKRDVNGLLRDDFVEMFVDRFSRAAELRAGASSKQTTNTSSLLSVISVRADVRVVRRVISWAAEEGVLGLDTAVVTRMPTAGKLPKSRLAPFVDFETAGLGHNAIFEAHEVARLVEVIDEIISQLAVDKLIQLGEVKLQKLKAARLALMALMVMSFGIRTQELHRLKFSHLSFTGSSFVVTMRTVAKTSSAINKAPRVCFMPSNQPRMLALLDAIVRYTEEGFRSRGSQYVFRNSERTSGSKNYYLSTLLEAAGLPLTRVDGDQQSRLTFTALRRTTISSWIDKDVPIQQVADFHGTSVGQVEASYRRTTALTSARKLETLPEPY